MRILSLEKRTELVGQCFLELDAADLVVAVLSVGVGMNQLPTLRGQMEPVEFRHIDPNLQNHLLGPAGEVAEVEAKLVDGALCELLLFDEQVAVKLELDPLLHGRVDRRR